MGRFKDLSSFAILRQSLQTQLVTCRENHNALQPCRKKGTPGQPGEKCPTPTECHCIEDLIATMDIIKGFRI